MSRREKELEEYQKAQKELKEKILEFLERNPEKKYTLKEITESIEIPSYWKGFDGPQREVIVSKELSHLVKLERVEEIEEEKEFKTVLYYRIRRK